MPRVANADTMHTNAAPGGLRAARVIYVDSPAESSRRKIPRIWRDRS